MASRLLSDPVQVMIPPLLTQTVDALCALVPGDVAHYEALYPELRTLEALVNQAVLAGDARQTATWCRVWERAWREAVGA